MVPFLSIENITAGYPGSVVLKDLSLQINEGENWLITGGSGSGKTTLLDIISGKHPVRSGQVRHHYYERYRALHPVNDPYFNYKNLISSVPHQHHFKNRYNMDDFYYQQRFNSADAEEALRVSDFLSLEAVEGLPGTLIRDLRLEELMEKSLIKLSNGETRRLLFAQALAHRPRLLLLDAPFTGLDAASRPYFRELIGKLIDGGITVVMTGTGKEIPPGITHIALLEQGTLRYTWKREDYSGGNESEGSSPFLPEEPGDATEALDEALLRQLLNGAGPGGFTYAVRMNQVRVSYGDVPVLRGIDWTVKRGERWALSGPNGAGKSTLLSLINADHPQAYANDIILFDRKRGSGESIWDIKKKIGFISPELHQYFRTADTCLQVVLSGLHDTLGLIRKCTPGQEEEALGWLRLLEVENHAGSRFRSAPLSVQRLALLARALIKRPPLLLLDEPCQGMDGKQVALIRRLVDAVCRFTGCTLIYVSHYTEEIPSCVDRMLQLNEGRASVSRL